MATFLMFGKYTAEGVKGISSQRTKQAADLIKKQGGQVKGMYAMLGMADLLLIVDLPGVETAIQTSVALGQMTGINFCTSPAVPVEEFDKLVGAK
jgi:uncharacterized protein with GYD domain